MNVFTFNSLLARSMTGYAATGVKKKRIYNKIKLINDKFSKMNEMICGRIDFKWQPHIEHECNDKKNAANTFIFVMQFQLLCWWTHWKINQMELNRDQGIARAMHLHVVRNTLLVEIINKCHYLMSAYQLPSVVNSLFASCRVRLTQMKMFIWFLFFSVKLRRLPCATVIEAQRANW